MGVGVGEVGRGVEPLRELTLEGVALVEAVVRLLQLTVRALDAQPERRLDRADARQRHRRFRRRSLLVVTNTSEDRRCDNQESESEVWHTQVKHWKCAVWGHNGVSPFRKTAAFLDSRFVVFSRLVQRTVSGNRHGRLRARGGDRRLNRLPLGRLVVEELLPPAGLGGEQIDRERSDLERRLARTNTHTEREKTRR